MISGLLFLPAAGTNGGKLGEGYYVARNSQDASHAQMLLFNVKSVQRYWANWLTRPFRISVRLVCLAQ